LCIKLVKKKNEVLHAQATCGMRDGNKLRCQFKYLIQRVRVNVEGGMAVGTVPTFHRNLLPPLQQVMETSRSYDKEERYLQNCTVPLHKDSFLHSFRIISLRKFKFRGLRTYK